MLLKKNQKNSHNARLLISCLDKPGIVAAVSQFLHSHGANILDSSQYTTNPYNGNFFMRMVFNLESLDLNYSSFEEAFKIVAEKFEMDWRIAYDNKRKRMAIMVSKYDHCFLELLWRHQRSELKADIPLVISNHETLLEMSKSFGIPYYYLPINKENKTEQEEQVLELLGKHKIDFIVLARYMQILSPSFVTHYPQNIINIHHSFLPAFIGANPYKKAYQRGVKLIGATAHYVTNNLDEGPIVEQDVERVSHRDGIKNLKIIGQDIERKVLVKAVTAHIEDKIIVFENKTVVFD